MPYFHLVFTLPDVLDPLALANPRVVYDLLLRSAAETVLELAADPEAPGCPDRRAGRAAHLGPDLAVPSPRPLRGAGWRVVTGSDLLGRLAARLLPAGRGAQPRYSAASSWRGCVRRPPPGNSGLSEPAHRSGAANTEFERLVSAAVRTDWVVHAKRPFAGPEVVLKYLARYTHRVAISNSRLLDFEDGFVRFRYKDYAHGNRKRVMRLIGLGVRAAALAPRAADGVRADSPLRHPLESLPAGESGVVPTVARRRATAETESPSR